MLKKVKIAHTGHFSYCLLEKNYAKLNNNF